MDLLNMLEAVRRGAGGAGWASDEVGTECILIALACRSFTIGDLA
jgi:hypothetical protein